MELIKTKRLHLTGKKAKAFYDDIYARDGGRCVRCGRPIAYGVKYDGDVWDFYAKKAVPQDAVPVGVVLTLAATGSEMSNSSVITNEDGWLKRGCNCDLSRPRFAIMNPDDVVLMFFFLVVSCISSGMTERFRRQLAIAEENERAARRMSEMSEKFINVMGTERIIALGLEYIRENTGYDAAVRLNGENEQEGENGYITFPIGGVMQQIGELKVFTSDKGMSAEQEIFIRAAAGQMGIALDRELIYAEQEKTKLQVEQELNENGKYADSKSATALVVENANFIDCKNVV